MLIHINKEGQQYGPYTIDQVNEYLAQGSLQTTDPAWHDGLAEWCPLSQIAGVVDPSSPTPPSFDPTTYNPNAAPPPAVATPSPTEAPVTAASVTCPGCQASVAPEMLFCATCGYDLQAGWQDKMTSYPTDAPQAEGSADSGQLLVSTNGPERLPAPITAKIAGYIMLLISVGFIVLGAWLSGNMYKKYKDWKPTYFEQYYEGVGMIKTPYNDENPYRFSALNGSNKGLIIAPFFVGLVLGASALKQILGARLCSVCKRTITKYDATCPGCKAMFERPA